MMLWFRGHKPKHGTIGEFYCHSSLRIVCKYTTLLEICDIFLAKFVREIECKQAYHWWWLYNIAWRKWLCRCGRLAVLHIQIWLHLQNVRDKQLPVRKNSLQCKTIERGWQEKEYAEGENGEQGCEIWQQQAHLEWSRQWRLTDNLIMTSPHCNGWKREEQTALYADSTKSWANTAERRAT